jgi:hypothetical protein
MDQIRWLLLLYSLPAHRNTARVAVWRRFRKIGALQLKTSAYLLPDRPTQYEHFQWLGKNIRDSGGDATLVRANEIDGVSSERLIDLFNKAREKEYAVLAKGLRALATRGKKADPQNFADELEKSTKQFREIRKLDFFDSPRAENVGMILRKLEGTRQTKGALSRLNRDEYRGKKWVTRPRPEIDRVGSAWLVRHFIDPEAEFFFAAKAADAPGAVSFDMPDADFTHHGDDCTFETMVKRFAIQDKTVRKIGEMIHDADLDDAKFQRIECVGIDRLLKGWAKQGFSDEELLKEGFRCFDGLHSFLRKI